MIKNFGWNTMEISTALKHRRNNKSGTNNLSVLACFADFSPMESQIPLSINVHFVLDSSKQLTLNITAHAKIQSQKHS